MSWIKITLSITLSNITPPNNLLLRLCLVRVKAFPKNIPFSENAIFWKRKYFYVFGYISKNFLKNIFWCLEKKKEKTNQTNPERRTA